MSFDIDICPTTAAEWKAGDRVYYESVSRVEIFTKSLKKLIDIANNPQSIQGQ